jgi:Asp-tRNA(Asn)/Glu-tRNA(Gln) amidotransferase A subunit family amidase
MEKIFKLSLIISTALLVGAVIGNQLDPDDLKIAGKVAGLDFSRSEIDSMYEGVERDRLSYIENRKNPLNNATAPALVFNPVPSGFEIPQEVKPLYFEFNDDVNLPDNIDDLAFYSVSELGTLIRQRKITSVELTTFFLERLKRHNSELHCVITLTEERAMRQAQQADQEIAAGQYRGLLHGIPYGAKDLFSVAGYPTTWGAMPYKDQVINQDAAVIQKLDEAGAVLLGKLSMGALAWGDVWYGEKTRNPWNTAMGSSGSSAGSGSAVAAGLVPFALGTETLGSIISPSTVNGITGLRPTFGRVSRDGAMALVWSMDKIGPMTRSAEDAAIVFSVLHGADSKDPTTKDFPFNYDSRTDISSLKIGYFPAAFDRDYAFKKNDSLIIELLKAEGIELIPITLPALPDLRLILNVESAAAFDELTTSNRDDLLVRQIKNAWPNVFRQARLVPAVEYVQANRRRSILIEQMQEVFEEVDVYLHPTWGGSSLTITNYTGHPSICFPNGFVDGLPSSISITGRLYDEASILHLAKFIQDRTDWHQQHPSGF